jgi:hypothetical protein
MHSNKIESEMEYYIEAGPKTKKFIESLLPSMLSQLKLTQSRKFLQIKLDKEIEHSGECIPLNGLNTYLVVLKPKSNLCELGVTLAHELTHVAQFAKGTLKVTPKGKRWKGKFYGRSVAYLQQPWEVQAFAKQELIFRRAID